jgi:mannose-6-phosphate isomerase-like protein (cupin superfamily)
LLQVNAEESAKTNPWNHLKKIKEATLLSEGESIMVRTADEMITEIRQQMRGGTGEVRIKQIFQPGEIKGKARLIAEFTLPEGSSVGFHTHDNEEEIYYFLSGRGEVDDNGERRRIGPGDAMHTGEGKGHAVFNTGSEPLQFMAVILLYD